MYWLFASMMGHCLWWNKFISYNIITVYHKIRVLQRVFEKVFTKTWIICFLYWKGRKYWTKKAGAVACDSCVEIRWCDSPVVDCSVWERESLFLLFLRKNVGKPCNVLRFRIGMVNIAGTVIAAFFIKFQMVFLDSDGKYVDFRCKIDLSQLLYAFYY